MKNELFAIVTLITDELNHIFSEKGEISVEFFKGRWVAVIYPK